MEIEHGNLAKHLVAIGCDESAIESASSEFYGSRLFGAWLVERGIATQSQVSLALARQSASRGDFSATEFFLRHALDEVSQQTADAVARFRVASVSLSSMEASCIPA